MTGPDLTGTDPTVMTPGAAYGFGQRRSWVFSAWWFSAVLAASGVAYSGFSLMLGRSPETGVVLAILGAAMSAMGWALTAMPRFTRKFPKPAADIPRVEQGIRTTPITIRTFLIATALGVAALAILTPGDAYPDILPVLAMIVTLAAGVCAGLAYIRRLMIRSAELYARWLECR